MVHTIGNTKQRKCEMMNNKTKAIGFQSFLKGNNKRN